MRCVPAFAAIVCLIACGGNYRTNGIQVPPVPEGSCDVNATLLGRTLPGDVEQRTGEGAVFVACHRPADPALLGAVLLTGIDPAMPAEARIAGSLPKEGPTAATPSKLSGVPATELRTAYELIGPGIRILRYVQRGDKLYYAYVESDVASITAREAENAAWLDAVRFDDLAP